jgi:uncharacterized protein YdeI (YjbR/CyaY-like superfamily)
MITEIETFFRQGCGRCDRFATPDCSVQAWAKGLAALRDLCRGAGLSETVKWGHPTYMHAGRNIALIGAFRGDFRLNFFNAALLGGGAGLLERQGPNTRHPDTVRFTSATQVGDRAVAILACLHEAKAHAEVGTRPPPAPENAEMPEVLIEALDADPELAEAFHALTPGRRKGYLIVIGAARKPATQTARIEGFRSHILAGKGPHDR